MDLGVLAGVQLADWLIIIFFIGFFVLGFAQGTIRRLIGLASILFSFLLAANLADPLGTFLANNWTDQSKQYSYMIGFLTVFVAASLAFAIVIQGFYRPQPLFEKARFVDELLGGALGSWFGLRTAIWVGVIGMSLAVLPVLLSPVRTLREMPEPVDEPLPSEAEAAGGLVPATAGTLPAAPPD